LEFSNQLQISSTKMNCIYCNSQGPFSDEHPLPACLGEFSGLELLRGRICSECNHKIGDFEQQFCRSGPEAFFRNVYGVKGREEHEKINIFRRGSFGAPAIDFVGMNPQLQIPILYEQKPGAKTVNIVNQIVIKDEDEVWHQIRILPWMKSADDIRNEIKKKTVKKIVETRVFPDDSEVERMEELLKGFGGLLEWKPPLEIHSIKDPVAQVTVSAPYFRAVAKIGFHYFLAVCPNVRGQEKEFESIRKFILEGTIRGGVVTQEEQNILFAPPNAVPNRRSHILIAELFKGVLYARMQFYIGPGFVPLTYRVVLSNTPPPSLKEFAAGHIFAYFEEGKKGRFSGEVFPLDVLTNPFENPAVSSL